MFAKMPFRPKAAQQNTDFFLRCATVAYAIAYLTWPDDDDFTPAPKVLVKFVNDPKIRTDSNDGLFRMLAGTFQISNLGPTPIKEAFSQFDKMTQGTYLCYFNSPNNSSGHIPDNIEQIMAQASQAAKDIVYNNPQPAKYGIMAKL